MPPQQRRAQATRHAILVAAAEEFDRVGYAGTPLSTILRRSGVTKGAFYFHFPSKEALASTLVRVQDRRFGQLWRRWTRRDLDPLSMAVGMIEEATRMLEQDVVLRAGLWLACQRVVLERGGTAEAPDWEQLLAEILRRSAENGQLRSGVDPVAAARVIYTALVGVRTLGSAGRDGATMADRVTEMWRVLLEGIASAEWLRKHPRWGMSKPLGIDH